MKTVVYEGEEYFHTGKNWVDKNRMVPPLAILSKLNFIEMQEVDFEKMLDDKIIEKCDEYKNSGSFTLALKGYEVVRKRNPEKVNIILPRMTSCYRALHKYQEAINLYTEEKDMFGDYILSVPLLTSIAAAYCDIEQYYDAKKFCNRAYAMLKNSPNSVMSGELSGVYGRIKKEYNL